MPLGDFARVVEDLAQHRHEEGSGLNVLLPYDTKKRSPKMSKIRTF